VTLANTDSITGGAVANKGLLDITGTTTITNDVVTQTVAAEIDIDGTLNLSGATITGGLISDETGGLLHVTGNSTINGGANLTGPAAGGAVTVDSLKTLT